MATQTHPSNLRRQSHEKLYCGAEVEYVVEARYRNQKSLEAIELFPFASYKLDSQHVEERVAAGCAFGFCFWSIYFLLSLQDAMVGSFRPLVGAE